MALLRRALRLSWTLDSARSGAAARLFSAAGDAQGGSEAAGSSEAAPAPGASLWASVTADTPPGFAAVEQAVAAERTYTSRAKLQGRPRPPPLSRPEKAAKPQQPTPPKAARYRRVWASPEQMRLNLDIMACASSSEVLDLIISRLDEANAVNVATALSRVASLPGADEAKHDARLRQLFAASLAHLAGMEEPGLCATLQACSKLELAQLPCPDVTDVHV